MGDGAVVGRGNHRRERGRWENGKDLSLLDLNDRDAIDPDLPGRATARVTFKERRRANKIAQQTHRLGYPPFIPPWMFPPTTFSCQPIRPPNHLLGPNWLDHRATYLDTTLHAGFYRHRKSSQSIDSKVQRELRAWCDDYCANKKCLKEFRVEKVVFGWNLALLEDELLKLLNSIPYLPSTHFSVHFYTSSSEIIVRPVNVVSKIFSLSGFSKFLMTITLIYPILWLLRYLILGAQYDVVRAAYPLVYWDQSSLASSRTCSSLPHPREILKGQTELDWLSANRHKIFTACQNSKIGTL